MKAFYRSLLLLILALSVASCGWVLRGTAIDQALVLSQLEYETTISPGVSRILDQTFTDSSVEGDEYLMTIVQEFQIERVQSLTSGLRTGQLRTEKRLQYRISAINGGRIETGVALVYRDLDQDEFTPGATEREKALLQQEIDEEIVQQLLRHLERFMINNAGDIQARKNQEQLLEQNGS